MLKRSLLSVILVFLGWGTSLAQVHDYMLPNGLKLIVKEVIETIELVISILRSDSIVDDLIEY